MFFILIINRFILISRENNRKRPSQYICLLTLFFLRILSTTDGTLSCAECRSGERIYGTFDQSSKRRTLFINVLLLFFFLLLLPRFSMKRTQERKIPPLPVVVDETYAYQMNESLREEEKKDGQKREGERERDRPTCAQRTSPSSIASPPTTNNTSKLRFTLIQFQVKNILNNKKNNHNNRSSSN